MTPKKIDYLAAISQLNGEVTTVNWLIAELEAKKLRLLKEYERLQNAKPKD